MRYRADVSATRISDAIDLGSAHGEPGDYMIVRDGGGEVVFLPAAVFEGIFEAPVNGKPRAARRGRKAQAAKAEEAEDGLGRRGAKTELAAEGLRQSPKTQAELRQWLKAHGWPDCTTIRVNSAVMRLKRQGRAKVAGGKWSLCG